MVIFGGLVRTLDMPLAAIGLVVISEVSLFPLLPLHPVGGSITKSYFECSRVSLCSQWSSASKTTSPSEAIKNVKVVILSTISV